MRALIVFAICFAVGFRETVYSQTIAPGKVPVQTASVSPQPVHRLQKRKAAAGRGPGNAQTPPTGNAASKTKPVKPPAVSFSDAVRRYRRESHDRAWWKAHYAIIVFVTGGYYYWDAGYWFPAWGYSPAYNNYDYDGPIYTYGNLLPDQVVYNVQRALQQLGYYSGNLTGSLGSSTRAALAAYQEDAGLAVTGAIDADTVQALGLY
jgi:hypothetical protein